MSKPTRDDARELWRSVLTLADLKIARWANNARAVESLELALKKAYESGYDAAYEHHARMLVFDAMQKPTRR